MKQLFLILFLASLTEAAQNLFCYYDSSSSTREYVAQLTISYLEAAMPFCSHLVYGYAGIRSENFEIYSLNNTLDIQNLHFSEITSLKHKYPHLKVLLSVGGDHDIDSDHPDKYIDLLETGKFRQKQFIRSALTLLKTYDFDGLDLAYQFPRNKPRKVHGTLGSFFKQIKKTFTGDYVVDPKAADHKEQFTALVHDLKDALQPEGLLLSLTVLPNVNSTWYFDIPTLSPLVDFVNLAAFDFITPARNPEEADHSAPLVSSDDQNRLAHYSADFQVQYWLKYGFPSKKLNLGVTSYGNAWKLSDDSGLSGKPVVEKTEGPAAEKFLSKKPGLVSYTEICLKLKSTINIMKDNEIPEKQVAYGNYAYRPAKGFHGEGFWISYDDINTLSHKANYADTYVGGLALFDLTYDDFQGLCTGAKYPVLRIINQSLRDFSAAVPLSKAPGLDKLAKIKS